jgi:protein involved in polysaccharide export with SLBB domain
MARKIFNFNLFLSLIFLVGTIFPSDLFSYETTDQEADKGLRAEWVDESLDHKSVTYKKVRCPRCNMEFYYVPGKDGPHSHWVQYESSDKGQSIAVTPELKLGEEKAGDTKKRERKESPDLLSSAEERIKKLEKELSEEKKKSLSGLQGFQGKDYVLRQKLTCPYDGHNFFPEGDEIEDTKLQQQGFVLQSPSIIESSFSKSIPFGVSKELRQFGYDLFVRDEEEKEKREEGSTTIGQTGEALTALGMLNLAMNQSPTTSSLFSSQTSTSNTAVVPVGPDYIVGPGDTLVINIWGSVQETFPVEIDREGKIMLPKAGPLYLWGLKLKDAEERIKKMLDRHYINFSMDVSMGKLRDIQVYVMGEVKKPGSYSISAQSTVFKAFYEAGGPTKLGSLRRIKLIHADGKKEEIDLYPLLLEGEAINPMRIQSGDTIFVPSIGDVVAIAGSVKRPAIYETKSEILLQDLLDFAGGIMPTGDLQYLQVERIENNERRIMLDMELDRTDVGKISLEGISMRNGDIVIAAPVVRLKHDFVSVIGNVERPGDYALLKDMKVSDLIERAKGFLPGTYLERAEIARVTRGRAREIIPLDLDSLTLGIEEEDIFLNEWDILLVYSESEAKSPSFVEIDGAINRPGRYELTPGMKISDLIFKAGGAKSDAIIRGAELFHIMPGEQPVVRRIEVKRISDADILVDKDIILRSGDALSIKSEPKLTQRRTVTVKGEVKYPGVYSIREGERISSLIERAGGFTKEAFPEGTVFTRRSIKEMQEKMRERFLQRENKRILEEQQSILLRRGTAVSGSPSESVKMGREMLEYIESVEIEGRMVTKLMPSEELKDTKYDILLEDEDSLNIPQVPSAIMVMGSINSPASVPFEKSKGIEYYIRRTGGLTKHADKAGIYVIKANGEAVSKFMMSKKIGRGSTIVVPQEFKYWTPPGQLLRDTVEMLSRIAIGIGIIAALD